MEARNSHGSRRTVHPQAGSISSRQRIGALLLGLLFLFSLRQPIADSDGTRNLFVLQAEAFLHGRTDIDRYAHDVAIFEDRFYVPFPPGPALLLTPWVAAFGAASTNVPLISLLFSLLNVVTLRTLLRRLSIAPHLHFWIIAAFFLGTAYWLAVLYSQGVWYFAHVVAVTFSLLALVEAFGRGRGWVVGLFLGLSFLSRQFTLGLAPVLVVVLWRNIHWPVRRRRLWSLIGLGVVLSTAVALYLSFNVLRFGHPLDTGYEYLELTGFLAQRVETYGLFSPAYIPFNLFYLFFQGFHIGFGEPYAMQPTSLDPFGTSLLAASPFVLLAFYARRPRHWVLAAWGTILLITLATSAYYNNGWIQYNAQRFTLDIWPLLIVLVALGLERQKEQPPLWNWLIGYAIGLNAFALYWLPMVNELWSQWLQLWSQ